MKDTPSFTVVPLHKRIELTRQCCKLVNSEWPRSEVARLRSLNASCDKFPTCLILLDESYVVGHCKISLVPNMCDSCFIESVVIDEKYRGRGLGTLLMRKSEKYVAIRGIENVYLSTKGQEGFYRKLGYKICEPVSMYGNLDTVNDSILVLPNANGIKKDFKNTDRSNENFNGGGRGGGGCPPPPPMPVIRNSGFPFSIAKTYMMKKLLN